jgi:hypothetical protein
MTLGSAKRISEPSNEGIIAYKRISVLNKSFTGNILHAQKPCLCPIILVLIKLIADNQMKLLKWTILLIPLLITQLAAESEAKVAALEAQLEEMRAQMLAMQGQMDTLQSKIVELKTEQEAQEEILATTPYVEPKPAASGLANTSKYGIRFYGKFKVDGIYDSADLGTSEYITYIPKDADGGSQTTFTGRETRVGLDIGGPAFGDWQAKGKLETDFYGSAQSGGSGSLRMRLAYVDLTNGRDGVRIGQDWLPIAGVNPSTLNFTVLGYNGNLWNRVPQVTYRRHLGGNWSGLVTAYRARDDEDDEHGLVCDLKMPWVGTKLAYEADLFGHGNASYFGISGAIRDGKVNCKSVTPHLLAAEWKIPFQAFELRGEAYYGEGLGAEYLHRGGAFNLVGTPIQTQGGMIQLGFQATPQVKLHLGYGFDDPKDADILADEFYLRNSTLYGNAMISLAEGLTVGLEGSSVETEYSDITQDGFRIQSAMIYLW